MLISTVCYIRNDEDWLMLHRTKKANDVNHGKWIGVGGKLIAGETPHETMLREVFEETGLIPDSYSLRGLLTFVYAAKAPEYIFVYRATSTSRDYTPCDEGTLAWIPESQILSLPLWDGDKLFLPPVLTDQTDQAFFSLKVVYDEADRLIEWRFD